MYGQNNPRLLISQKKVWTIMIHTNNWISIRIFFKYLIRYKCIIHIDKKIKYTTVCLGAGCENINNIHCECQPQILDLSCVYVLIIRIIMIILYSKPRTESMVVYLPKSITCPLDITETDIEPKIGSRLWAIHVHYIRTLITLQSTLRLANPCLRFFLSLYVHGIKPRTETPLLWLSQHRL